MNNHGIKHEDRDDCQDHQMTVGADYDDDGPEAHALYREWSDFCQLNVHTIQGREVNVTRLEESGTFTIGTDLWFNLFVDRDQAKHIHKMLGELLEASQ